MAILSDGILPYQNTTEKILYDKIIYVLMHIIMTGWANSTDKRLSSLENEASQFLKVLKGHTSIESPNNADHITAYC